MTERTRRPGALRRLWRRLFTPLPPAGIGNALVQEQRWVGPGQVPADRGAAEYTVYCRLVFSARGLEKDTLTERADAYLESVWSHVFKAVWAVGRAHPPHRPDLAEAAMNTELASGWCQEEDGVVVSCAMHVYVTAAPEIIGVQRPLWTRMAELDTHQRLEHRRIEVVDDLLTRWQDLIARHGNAPQVVHAARLADKELAAALSDLAKDRVAQAEDLITVLRETRDAHHFLGLYEFSTAYDTALRSFEHQAGLRQGTLAPGAEGDPS